MRAPSYPIGHRSQQVLYPAFSITTYVIHVNVCCPAKANMYRIL